MSKTNRIIIENTEEEKFSFQLQAGNGKRLLYSKPLATKDACLSAIDTTKRLIKEQKNFTVKKTEEFEPYFVIEDGEIEITSRIYASKANLREALPNIQRNIETAVIEDRT